MNVCDRENLPFHGAQTTIDLLPRCFRRTWNPTTNEMFLSALAAHSPILRTHQLRQTNKRPKLQVYLRTKCATGI